MSIHSLNLPEGVDIDQYLQEDVAGEDTVESQDNMTHEDYVAMGRAESSYHRVIGKRAAIKRSRWNWRNER